MKEKAVVQSVAGREIRKYILAGTGLAAGYAFAKSSAKRQAESEINAMAEKSFSVNEVYARSVPPVRAEERVMRRPVKVLIVGAGSYIGENIKRYLLKREGYEMDTLDAYDLKPQPRMFELYDAVFFAAGIAHRKETKENAHLYYEVNRDLAVQAAEAAKSAGVPHFIVLSSMSVYGMETGRITKDTKACPKSHYGKSKLQADERIWSLRDEKFRVAILRPPMVYGKGCRGNYQPLRKLALMAPVFPRVDNERSMIYIGNLCAFVEKVLEKRMEGIFFPQNGEYVNTCSLAARIAAANGKRMRQTRIFNPVIGRLHLKTAEKLFGSLTYESGDAVHECGFEDSVSMTESSIM